MPNGAAFTAIADCRLDHWYTENFLKSLASEAAKGALFSMNGRSVRGGIDLPLGWVSLQPDELASWAAVTLGGQGEEQLLLRIGCCSFLPDCLISREAVEEEVVKLWLTSHVLTDRRSCLASFQRRPRSWRKCTGRATPMMHDEHHLRHRMISPTDIPTHPLRSTSLEMPSGHPEMDTAKILPNATKATVYSNDLMRFPK